MNKQLFYFIPAFITILILIFLGLKISYNLKNLDSQNEVISILIGKEPPKISTERLYENKKKFVINKNTKGPYLLNFFSSWCVPCQYEAPYLNELSKKVDLYGIAYKDRFSETKKFLNSFGNPYLNIGVDEKGYIAIDWGVYGVPETFLIDSNNIVIFRHAGPITEEIIKRKIFPELKKLGL